MIAYISERSKKNAGKPLYPHKHKDGMYVASHSRFEADYVRVENLEQLQALVQLGYGARMSNPSLKPRVAASIIVSKNIEIEDSFSVETELRKISTLPELDVEFTAKRRAEQTLLRAYLLEGNKLATCAICNSKLPENMLVAAHIKRRSKCSDDEKLDFGAVATLMCKLGCDDLYEKGYIYVDKGIVRSNPNAVTTEALDSKISSLVGNEVSNWEESRQYYEWHCDKWGSKKEA
ncbi:hypothetical protein P7M41_24090 [Vibrio parahaemolyticus]|uniref:HNH endonuclease n=1 Tax=Vibrio parahaemolyticus TaxID=670 RepID=UPI0011216C84|nr:HNH endonuclease [Vibrio parahaemolyticus]MDF4259452.1 hypothetical protein [Vibrio parahaemolyticus]MDF4264581.1 hypothetical protein [Vibrio parahaemolyticus]MDF4326531.1 hypothetical protein [Vibrio parahaemolyticus]MDG2555111.1 hypothetical protein [Vibrio parahaemolyticus]TOG45387.1 hypothetical protein CGJ00_22725 [Vibrio parahaemolyticus]